MKSGSCSVVADMQFVVLKKHRNESREWSIEEGTSASGSPHSLPAISSSCTPKDANGFIRILEFPARAAADKS